MLRKEIFWEQFFIINHRKNVNNIFMNSFIIEKNKKRIKNNNN